jgi:hypothetical protein
MSACSTTMVFWGSGQSAASVVAEIAARAYPTAAAGLA